MADKTSKKPKEERPFPWMTTWTFIAATAAIVAAWAAWAVVWKPALSKREGLARIGSQLDYLEVVVEDLIVAVPDSTEAGQNHASARNMGSSQVVAYEKSHSLSPLRSRLRDRWITTNSAIAEALASMDAGSDTLTSEDELKPLYERYQELRNSTDSLMTTMDREMTGWREF